MLKVVIFPLPSNWFERFLVIIVEHDSVCGFIKLWFVVNLLALLFTVNNMHVIWKCKRFGEFFFLNTMVKNYNQNCQLLKKKIRMHYLWCFPYFVLTTYLSEVAFLCVLCWPPGNSAKLTANLFLWTSTK